MKYSIYKIADVVVKIGVVYKYTEDLLCGYEYFGSDEPEITIAFEKEKIDEIAKAQNEFSAVYLENILIYGEFCKFMFASHDGFIFHCSSFSYENKGILLAAPSGTGKSTHARMWRETFGDKVVMVNDDKPIIRLVDGEFFVYGTPWSGKHRLGNNICVKIDSLCFVEQSKEIAVEKISAMQAVQKILMQTMLYETEELQLKLLEIVEKMIAKIKLFKIKVDISHEAAIQCRDAILGVL